MESAAPQPAASTEGHSASPGATPASSSTSAPVAPGEPTAEAPFAAMKKMHSDMLKGWENYWEKQVDQARPLLPKFVLPYLPPKPGEDDGADVRVIRAPSSDPLLGKGEFNGDTPAPSPVTVEEEEAFQREFYANAAIEPMNATRSMQPMNAARAMSSGSLNEEEDSAVPPEGKARCPSPRPDPSSSESSPTKQDDSWEGVSRTLSKNSIGDPEKPAARPPSSKPSIVAEPSSRSSSNPKPEVVEPGLAKLASDAAAGQDDGEAEVTTVASTPGTASEAEVAAAEQAGETSAAPIDKRGEVQRSLDDFLSFMKRPATLNRPKSFGELPAFASAASTGNWLNRFSTLSSTSSTAEADSKKVEPGAAEEGTTTSSGDAAAESGAALPGISESLTEASADTPEAQRAGDSVASAGGRAVPFQGSSVASAASVESDAGPVNRPLTAFAEQLAVTTSTSAEKMASRICEQFQQYCLEEAGMGLSSCTSEVPLPGKRNVMSQVAREFASQVERLGFEKLEWWTGKDWREAQGRFHILHDNVYDKYYMRLKVTWLVRPPRNIQPSLEREATHISLLEQLQQTLELQRQFLERALEAQISTNNLTEANNEQLKQLQLSAKGR